MAKSLLSYFGGQRKQRYSGIKLELITIISIWLEDYSDM